MTEEEKKLLIKDLCTRLPHKVKCDIGDGKPYTLCSISNDYYDGILIGFEEQKNGFDMEVYLSEVKPYLYPLSNITEEQKKQLKVRCDWNDNEEDIQSILVLYHKQFVMKSDVIDWLNKNHFDYRCLIKKGLALNATGLNIY